MSAFSKTYIKPVAAYPPLLTSLSGMSRKFQHFLLPSDGEKYAEITGEMVTHKFGNYSRNGDEFLGESGDD
jgi:hypothetical protein